MSFLLKPVHKAPETNFYQKGGKSSAKRKGGVDLVAMDNVIKLTNYFHSKLQIGDGSLLMIES